LSYITSPPEIDEGHEDEEENNERLEADGEEINVRLLCKFTVTNYLFKEKFTNKTHFTILISFY
ncbi:hypothetical protein ILUMI_15646, partial [Ignelater luminosus]